MKNLKERISEVNKENPSIDDLKYVSIERMYRKYKKERDLKHLKRLKFLVTFYPNIIEKNNANILKRVIEEPDGMQMSVVDRKFLYAYEKYAVDKFNSDRPFNGTDYCLPNYYITDVFEYFGIK